MSDILERVQRARMKHAEQTGDYPRWLFVDGIAADLLLASVNRVLRLHHPQRQFTKAEILSGSFQLMGMRVAASEAPEKNWIGVE